MQANERLFRASVLHQVLLSRQSNGVVAAILKLIREADDDILANLQARLGVLSQTDLDRLASGKGGETTRLARLLEYIRSLESQGRELIETGLTNELEGLATAEAAFQQAVLARSAPVALQISVPAVTTLEAAVRSRPFQGRILREWASQWGKVRKQKVMAEIRQGVLQGDGERAMARRVRDVLGGSQRSARMIARTAHTHVTNYARERVAERNEDITRGVVWVSVLDSRTSGICRARSGNIYPIDSGPRPPAHPNCLPPDALVSSRYRVTGASKHRFDGDLVVISTASGKQISCTPNHPILTSRGWVPAKIIDVGSDVISDADPHGGCSGVDVNHEAMPSRIEDVAEAFFSSVGVCTMPVPTTAKDFHGDAIDGDIAVIGTNGFLADSGDSFADKASDDGPLVVRRVTLNSLSRFGRLRKLFDRSLSATNGIMRGARKSLALLCAGSVHSGLLLCASAPDLNAAISEYSSNNSGRNTNLLCQCREANTRLINAFGFLNRGIAHSHLVSRFWSKRFFEFFENPKNWAAGATKLFAYLRGVKAAPVEANNFCGINGADVPSNRDVSFFEPRSDGGDADAKIASDILSGATGPVFIDNVVGVSRRYFSGHVYNLETEKGFYIAGGIVTHNCRSTTALVFKNWRQLGYKSDELTDAQKEALSGDPDVGETYSEYFAKLPRAAQVDIIGETRTRLFRKGGLGHDDLVSASTGREWTLDELKRREPEAFEKAGL